MIGPDNWCMVKCAAKGCKSPKWLMHWPCEGTEDEIRNGKHYCMVCLQKKWEKKRAKYTRTKFPVTLPQVVFQDEDEDASLTAELRRIAQSKVKK
jgi:hypothetical protein